MIEVDIRNYCCSWLVGNGRCYVLNMYSSLSAERDPRRVSALTADIRRMDTYNVGNYVSPRRMWSSKSGIEARCFELRKCSRFDSTRSTFLATQWSSVIGCNEESFDDLSRESWLLEAGKRRPDVWGRSAFQGGNSGCFCIPRRSVGADQRANLLITPALFSSITPFWPLALVSPSSTYQVTQSSPC